MAVMSRGGMRLPMVKVRAGYSKQELHVWSQPKVFYGRASVPEAAQTGFRTHLVSGPRVRQTTEQQYQLRISCNKSSSSVRN